MDPLLWSIRRRFYDLMERLLHRGSINILETIPCWPISMLLVYVDEDVVKRLRPATMSKKYYKEHFTRRRALWECHVVTVQLEVCESYPGRYAQLSDAQMADMRDHQQDIKHLTLVFNTTFTDHQTNKFLLDYAMKSFVLKSVCIVIDINLRDEQRSLKCATHFETLERLIAFLWWRVKEVSTSVEVTIENSFFFDLKLFDTFDSFWFYAKSVTLTVVPSVTNSVRTFHSSPVGNRRDPVERFLWSCRHVEHLELYVSLLSDKMLLYLAQIPGHEKPPLRTLTIHKTGLPVRGIPDLSLDAWSALLRAFPCLQVSCHIRGGVQTGMLERLLKPGVPLFSLIVEESSIHLQNSIINSCRLFSRTLRLVKCHTSSGRRVGKFSDLVGNGYLMTTMYSTPSRSGETITVF